MVTESKGRGSHGCVQLATVAPGRAAESAAELDSHAVRDAESTPDSSSWLKPLMNRLGRNNVEEPDLAAELADHSYGPQDAAKIIHGWTGGQKRRGSLVLAGTITGPLQVPPMACALVVENVKGDFNVVKRIGALTVEGRIDGSIQIDDDVSGSVTIRGSTTGDLVLSGRVSGDLVIDGRIGGGVVVRGEVAGGIEITGNGSIIGANHEWAVEIQKNVKHIRLSGSVPRNLLIRSTAQISGDVTLEGEVGSLHVAGHLGGEFMAKTTAKCAGTITVAGTFMNSALIECPVGGVTVSPIGKVKGSVLIRDSSGPIEIHGPIERGVTLAGHIASHIDLVGAVGHSVWIDDEAVIDGSIFLNGTVDGEVRVDGSVDGVVQLHKKATINGPLFVSNTVRRLQLEGLVNGRIDLTGAVLGGIALNGAFQRRVGLTPGADPNVMQPIPCALETVANARFAGEVYVGDNIDISECDFRGCSDLHRLHLAGGHLFTRHKTVSNIPAGKIQRVPAKELESIDRELRAALEQRANRPAANHFYTGEMNARLDNARERGDRKEVLILTLYRWLSGYGLVAWKPAAWFAATALIGWLLLGIGMGLDLALDPTREWATSTQRLLFTVKSMVGLFSPPSADLSVNEQWLQLLLRILGPLLLAQFVLAVPGTSRPLIPGHQSN